MLKVLGKGEWKLDGMEILAFGDMMRWFASIQKAIEIEVTADDAVEKARVDEQKRLNDGTLEPKLVEDVIKPVDAPVATPRVSKKQKG
jgi:hypothetical protein